MCLYSLYVQLYVWVCVCLKSMGKYTAREDIKLWIQILDDSSGYWIKTSDYSCWDMCNVSPVVCVCVCVHVFKVIHIIWILYFMVYVSFLIDARTHTHIQCVRLV